MNEQLLRDRLAELADHARTEPRRPLVDEVVALGESRRGRPRWTYPLAVAAVLLVAGGLAVVMTRDRNSVRLAADDSTIAGVSTGLADLQPGESRRLPAAPIEARSGMAFAWTGTELLIWGGSNFDGNSERYLADGAAYDPRADSWRTLADGPLSGRAYPAFAWTGSELVIWAGNGASGFTADGAAYDPASDSWRTIAASPLGPHMASATLWTGSELLFVGGLNAGSEGAAYRPDTDSWRGLPRAPGNVQGRSRPVWTGSQGLFLLNGYRSGPGGGPGGDPVLASYDPNGNAWSVVEAPGLSGEPALAWSGSEALFVTAGGSKAYRPESGTWRSLASPPTWPGHGVVSSGSSLIFPTETAQPAVFDIAADRWVTAPPSRGSQLLDAAVVWADGVVLWWGGLIEGVSQLAMAEGGMVFAPPAPLPGDGVQTDSVVPPTSTTGAEQRVPIAGPGDGSPGYIVENGPTVSWNGQVTPLFPVYDEQRRVVGYFGPGCGGFISAAEFAAPGFDPFVRCDQQRTQVTVIEGRADGSSVERDGNGQVIRVSPATSAPG